VDKVSNGEKVLTFSLKEDRDPSAAEELANG